ncbi:MAG: hypothetical protein NC311_06630 [Muribaculaceae bacterium]|nr:hypothetical protein [Muribaculaceae bacterium]
MNIAQGAETFTKMFPSMMKATKLLIIDHDVTRYHSFDLLRYTLFTRKDLFVTLKPAYHKLITPNVELAEQVQFMRTTVPEFNIFDMFGKDEGVHTTDQYSDHIRSMITGEHAKTTPTDVSERFEVVFDKPDITGYLLQYKGETNRPAFYGKVTVYEDANLLNLKVAVKLIIKHSINAVMICSNELAVRLIAMLVAAGHTTPITFIIARYAYNFQVNDDKCVVPTCNSEMGALEVQYKHEFGFFDPFSGLTFRYRFLREQNNEE